MKPDGSKSRRMETAEGLPSVRACSDTVEIQHLLKTNNRRENA